MAPSVASVKGGAVKTLDTGLGHRYYDPMKWHRAFFGWAGIDGDGHRWSIRGPIFGKAMFWLYRDGNRFSPTGKFDDAVSFTTAGAAKAYVARNQTNPGG